MRPASFQSRRVRRWVRQSSRLWICIRSRRLRRRCRSDCSIWATPASRPVVQTLVARKSASRIPSSAPRSPTTPSAAPYIGDESITRPPSSKKRCRTSLSGSRGAADAPTSKVRHVPRPTAGIVSPPCGMGRRRIVAAASVPRGRAPAAAAIRRSTARRESGAGACPTEPSARLPERRGDLGNKPIQVAAQLGQGTEQARDEQHARPGLAELVEPVADLVRSARQAGVARVGGVAAEARGDRLGQTLDLVLPVGDEQHHVGRARDGLRIAADGGAMRVEDRSLPCQDPRAPPDIPLVGVLGHDAQGDALAAAADHQLGMGRLHWLGIERSIRELVVAPLEVAAALGPQGLHHLARLVQTLQPLAHRPERDAVGLVLVLLPARAEPQEEPAARDDVDLRGHLRDHRRVAVGVAQHDGAHADAGHQSGQRAERAPRFDPGPLALLRVRHEVVGHAADVPSRGLDVSPQVQHAGPGLGAHAREQAEAHVSLLLEALPRCRGSRTGGDSSLAPPPGLAARPRLAVGAVAGAVAPPGQLIDLQGEEHMVYDIRIEDVEYVRHGGKPLLARLFKPRGSGPFPLVVELHGAAWCRGDRLNDTAINVPLAKSDVVVAALDFRMPPEAPYPASLADINYAIRWLNTRATALGSRPDLVGVLGTSSAAHQAMLAAMRPRDPRYSSVPLSTGAPAVDASVRGVAMCWPVIDPLARYHYAKKLKDGGKPYPEVVDRVLPCHDQYWQTEEAMAEGSPVQALERGERVALPPVLYIQGTRDQAHPRADLDRFVARYRAAGGEVELELFEGEAEGFVVRNPTSPAATRAAEKIVEFVHKRIW